MDLVSYISDIDKRRALARLIGTSPVYLWQMATGWRGKRPSEDMAVSIERATNRAVRCESLRPDISWIRDETGLVTGYTVRLEQGAAPRELASN
jgi:DNA-binding transcriptional regulator YdaS (Cro superfamily)